MCVCVYTAPWLFTIMLHCLVWVGRATTLENYWTPRQWHGIVRDRDTHTHIEDPREIAHTDRKVKKSRNVNFIVQAVSLVPRVSIYQCGSVYSRLGIELLVAMIKIRNHGVLIFFLSSKQKGSIHCIWDLIIALYNSIPLIVETLFEKYESI